LELAQAVSSLVSGGGDDSGSSAESLLVNLRSYADMAERYERPDGKVQTRISFERLGMSSTAAVIRDAGGVPQVHYALEIPASKLAWVGREGRSRISFGVSCRILDLSGGEVDVIEDWLDLDLGEEERVALSSQTLSFQGRLILPTGRYRLVFALTSAPAGTRDAATLEVDVPGDFQQGVSSILLGRSRRSVGQNGRVDVRPFQINGSVWNPSPDGRFPLSNALAYLELSGLVEPVRLEWSLSSHDDKLPVWKATSAIVPGPNGVGSAEEIVPLNGLPDGVYTLVARSAVGEREVQLTVDRTRVSRPVRVLSRESLPAGDGRIRFRRGLLFARIGDVDSAIEEMTEASRLLPDNLEIHLKLASLLYGTGQYDRVVGLLRPLGPQHSNEPDLWVLLGFASLRMGRNEEALSFLERARSLRPDDERLTAAVAEARGAARP
jgi:Tetratricopeptide repeat